MKKRIRNIIIVSTVLAVAVALAVGGRTLQARRGSGPKSVRVTVSKVGDLTTTVSATGAVKSSESVDVRSEISGIVEEVRVREGDRVERGEVLVVLKDDDLQSKIKGSRTALISAQNSLGQIESDTGSMKLRNRASVEGARLALLEARRQLNRLRGGPDDEELSRLEFSLEQARMSLSDAEEEYDHLKAIAQAEATARLKGAESVLISSQKNAEELRKGPNERTLANLENGVEQARVNLENAKLTVESAGISLDKARLALKSAERAAVGAKAALDDARLKADLAVERARAGLQAAESSVESASISAEGAKLSMESARLSVRDAEANLSEADRELERTASLFKEGAVSMQQLEVAQNRRKGAETAYQVAMSRYDQEKLRHKGALASLDQVVIKLGASRLDLKEAESIASQLASGTSQAEANYESALINLDQARSGLLEAKNLLSQREAGLRLAVANYEASHRQLELFKAEITDLDLKLAESRQEEAKANLEITKLSSDRNLTKARLRYESAKLQYENASKTLRLFKKRITEEDIRVAEARVAQAQANLDLALSEEAKGNEEDIKLSRSRVGEAQTNLELLQDHLAKTLIRAPISGTVVKRSVDPTGSVAPGSPILTIADHTRLIVEADVDEVDIGSVDVGQRATIKSDAFIGRELPGHVVEIAPRAEKVGNINSVKTKVAIDENDGRLKVGITATVSIVTNHRERVVFVPLEAIEDGKIESDGDGAESNLTEKYVFVVRQDAGGKSDKKKKAITGTLLKVEVVTGLSNLNNVEVKSGLGEGESVVVSDKKKLKDRDRVKVQPESESRKES
jgi:HlyD family secretion protein